MKILKDFIQFIKKPTEFFSEKLSFKEKLKMLLVLLWGQYVFLLCIIYPFLFLVNEYVMPLKMKSYDWGIFKLLLLGILVVPFIEEILFRLPLRYKRNYIFQLLNFISGNRVQKIWKKYYTFFFYGFSIAFGLLHITNYENAELLFYCIAPILVISQLLGGFILGYIRLKAGFFWGFLFHALFNSILIVGSIVLYHNTETISYSDTKIEKFSLYELQYIEKNAQYSKTSTNKEGNLIEFHCNDISLNSTLIMLGIQKKVKGSDRWINLDIVAPKGISKEKIVEILEKEYKFERKKK